VIGSIEIAEKGRKTSDEAVVKASNTSAILDQWGAAANSIGKVIETITDISDQVNLPALNATIGAVRAGKAARVLLWWPTKSKNRPCRLPTRTSTETSTSALRYPVKFQKIMPVSAYP
jgi:hypothetical protein